MKKILLNKWAYWPTINEELGEKALFLDGYVLNAGSGSRKVDLLNAKKVINFDISKNYIKANFTKPYTFWFQMLK